MIWPLRFCCDGYASVDRARHECADVGHPATQRNIKILIDDGIHFVGPNQGDMACGEYGLGRMAEPMEIMETIHRLLMNMDAAKPLSGRRSGYFWPDS